jgi:formate dehydrogenase maturation protein FdhE
LNTFETLNLFIERLSIIDSVFVLDIDFLGNLQYKFHTLRNFFLRLEKRELEFNSLHWLEKLQVPEAIDTKQHKTRIDLLNSWISKLRFFKTRFPQLEIVDQLKTLSLDRIQCMYQKLINLNLYIKKFEKINCLVMDLERLYQVSVNEETQITIEIDALGVCPMCAQPIKSSIFHQIASCDSFNTEKYINI